MCTVHRNRILSRRYTRNVYFGNEQNILQTVNQKCVLCTETEHFLDRTSVNCTVHRNSTLSRLYYRNVYCAHKHNTFQTLYQKCLLCTETISTRYIRNLYCVHKQNTFQAVHQKCVLCTETEYFPDGTQEMCTLETNRTFSRR